MRLKASSAGVRGAAVVLVEVVEGGDHVGSRGPSLLARFSLHGAGLHGHPWVLSVRASLDPLALLDLSLGLLLDRLPVDVVLRVSASAMSSSSSPSG